MCEPRRHSDAAEQRPEDQLATILFRDLHLAYPVLGGDVKSFIFKRWDALKILAHAIHEQDRRKGRRDRRA